MLPRVPFPYPCDVQTRDELSRLAQTRVVERGVAPGAVLAVAGRKPDGTWLLLHGAAGHRSVSSPTPVATDTVYDLASVTKPFVALTARRLARRGVVRFDEPLNKYVPQLGSTHGGSATLESSLSHRSGLQAHVKLHRPLLEGRELDPLAQLVEAADARREECAGTPPTGGFPPVYSDLGYLLAGRALAAAAQRPLDELIAEEVLRPLGLQVGSARQWRQRVPLDRFAPTEHELWRGGEICGEVHDENSWALAGLGVAGAAGLFGTAVAVARFGVALLEANGGANDWLCAQELEPHLRPRPGGSARMGFDSKSPTNSTAGAAFSRSSFGHLGFTGTSLWCDPQASIAAVVLTNRVCPSRDQPGPAPIRAARPELHDALHHLVRVIMGR